MQSFGLFICTQSALHVSGDVFAHRQEHLTVFTACGLVHLCCCRPVLSTRWNFGRQQHSWTISWAVNTVKCSWWWAKTSPGTCRADWVQTNKPKIYILLILSYELCIFITLLADIWHRVSVVRIYWCLEELHSAVLMMEAAHFFETSVHLYQTAVHLISVFTVVRMFRACHLLWGWGGIILVADTAC